MFSLSFSHIGVRSIPRSLGIDRKRGINIFIHMNESVTIVSALNGWKRIVIMGDSVEVCHVIQFPTRVETIPESLGNFLFLAM